MTRVCLDSNVLVAAFASRGLCADLLSHVLGEHQLVVPDTVRAETLRVLSEKIGLPNRAIQSVTAVLDRCERAAPTDRKSPVSLGDPDDEAILAESLEAGVQILVSGDKDFLAAAEGAPLSILSPRAFMTLMRGGER